MSTELTDAERGLDILVQLAIGNDYAEAMQVYEAEHEIRQALGTTTDADRNAALVRENARLREQVARVEALADEWERHPYAVISGNPRTRLRAALADPTDDADQTPAQSNAAVSRFYAANPRVDAGPDVRADLQRSFGELA